MFGAFLGLSTYIACGIGMRDTGDTDEQIQPMDTVKSDAENSEDEDLESDSTSSGSEDSGNIEAGFEPESEPPPPEPADSSITGPALSWGEDVLPIMEQHCDSCHIGWSATIYTDVVDMRVYIRYVHMICAYRMCIPYVHFECRMYI